MRIDFNLGIVVTFFRSVTDLFYLLHIIMKFRTAFVAPSSRVFGRGELVMDPWEIAYRYLKSDFLIDLAATLPLPQVSVEFRRLLLFGFSCSLFTVPSPISSLLGVIDNHQLYPRKLRKVLLETHAFWIKVIFLDCQLILEAD